MVHRQDEASSHISRRKELFENGWSDNSRLNENTIFRGVGYEIYGKQGENSKAYFADNPQG